MGGEFFQCDSPINSSPEQIQTAPARIFKNPPPSLRDGAGDAHAAGDERRPARLVGRPQAAAGFAVEVLVKPEHSPPVRIVGESVVAAETGAASFIIGQEDSGEARGQLARDLPRGSGISGAGGTLDFQLVAVEMVIPFEGLDQQVVERHPDRPAPI